jgi:hypothetical protein
MKLYEIAQALKSPDAKIESSAYYENRRGSKGYKTSIRSGAHCFMFSLPHTDHEVRLSDIATALSLPDAAVVSEGTYENRAGTKGYHASVLARGQWYLLSISGSEETSLISNLVANDASSLPREDARDSNVKIPVADHDFIGILRQIIEFFSSENKEEVAEFLLDHATNGFYVPTREHTEEFFTSLIEELDVASTDLRKDPEDLVDEIENIEEYFPHDEGIAAVVRDDYRLRGLLHQIFQREPSEPLPERLKGLRFGAGIRELKTVLTESRHFIVKGRGIVQGVCVG